MGGLPPASPGLNPIPALPHSRASSSVRSAADQTKAQTRSQTAGHPSPPRHIPELYLRNPPDHDIADLTVVPGSGTGRAARHTPHPAQHQARPAASPRPSQRACSPRLPGVQRSDTDQLVHPFHHAGHRGDELVILHIGAVAPVETSGCLRRARGQSTLASPPPLFAIVSPHVPCIRGDRVPRSHQVLLGAPRRVQHRRLAGHWQPHGDGGHLD